MQEGTKEETDSPPNLNCLANDSTNDDAERQLLMQQTGLADIDEFLYISPEPTFTPTGENFTPDGPSELVVGLIFKSYVQEVNELVIGTTIAEHYYYSRLQRKAN